MNTLVNNPIVGARADVDAVDEPSFVLRGARVGFVSGRLFYGGDDSVWTDAPLGRPLDVLRQFVGHLTLALAPAQERLPLLNHRLSVAPDDVLPLPRLPSIARGFHKFSACRRIIRELERRTDIVIVQLPFEAPLALLGAQTPRVYHLCADIWESARCSSRYAGFKRLPALAAGRVIDRLQAFLCNRPNVRVVANGEALLAHYGPRGGRAVVSSTLAEREILSVSRERPPDAPFRVLFVGYLRHDKGIDLLVEAFKRVLNAIPTAELEIVGARDGASRSFATSFEKSLAEISRRSTVRFLGHRDFGPELFQCYADADVLVVPSRTEGTPRVLVEARGFGCPVVGTSVGGVSTSIANGIDGLLVPREDPAALADAILTIAQNRSLRERLILGGIDRARRSTVEAFSRVLAAEAAAVLISSKVGE